MTARDLPFGTAPKLATDFKGIEERLPYELAKHFPHVLARIEAPWPGAAVLTHLDSLLFADRPDRQGFTPEALAEIFVATVIVPSPSPFAFTRNVTTRKG